MQHGKSLNHCLSEDSSGDSTERKDLVQTSVCITQHKWSSQVDLYLLIYFILFFLYFLKKFLLNISIIACTKILFGLGNILFMFLPIFFFFFT